jgi:hypothetical protein
MTMGVGVGVGVGGGVAVGEGVGVGVIFDSPGFGPGQAGRRAQIASAMAGRRVGKHRTSNIEH